MQSHNLPLYAICKDPYLDTWYCISGWSLLIGSHFHKVRHKKGLGLDKDLGLLVLNKTQTHPRPPSLLRCSPLENYITFCCWANYLIPTWARHEGLCHQRLTTWEWVSSKLVKYVSTWGKSHLSWVLDDFTLEIHTWKSELPSQKTHIYPPHIRWGRNLVPPVHTIQ